MALWSAAAAVRNARDRSASSAVGCGKELTRAKERIESSGEEANGVEALRKKLAVMSEGIELLPVADEMRVCAARVGRKVSQKG